MPQYEVNARHARKQSGLEIIYMSPVVTPEDREAWEAYSVENQGWIESARQIGKGRQQEYNIPGNIAPFITKVNLTSGRIVPVSYSKQVR